MKRFMVAGLLALTVAGVAGTIAHAFPPGIGDSDKHIGRIRGFWMQPTTGRLYDYSPYFAANYPQIPGSQEYLGQGPSPYGAYPIGGGNAYGAMQQDPMTGAPAQRSGFRLRPQFSANQYAPTGGQYGGNAGQNGYTSQVGSAVPTTAAPPLANPSGR
jgi:hypothetical protein